MTTLILFVFMELILGIISVSFGKYLYENFDYLDKYILIL